MNFFFFKLKKKKKKKKKKERNFPHLIYSQLLIPYFPPIASYIFHHSKFLFILLTLISTILFLYLKIPNYFHILEKKMIENL